MDKKTFYAELTKRLDVLGVSRELVERHIKQFDSYFEGKNEDEIRSEIERLGDLDRVAARIKRMTDKLAEREMMESSTENAPTETASTESVDVQKEPAFVSIPSETVVAEENGGSEPEPVDEASSADDAQESSVSDDDVITFTPVRRSDVYRDEMTAGDAEQEAELPNPVYEGRKRGETEPEVSDQDSPSIDENALRKRRTLFWTIFVLTLPFTLALCGVGAALFAIVFFAIAVLMIGLIAILVGITAIATLVSVFGIIFGVSQMLSSLPIGLYECGLAIVFGSLSMFVGILIYNVAVRLLPFAAKWLLVFFKYLCRKIKQLFIYLKKECIGL